MHLRWTAVSGVLCACLQKLQVGLILLRHSSQTERNYSAFRHCWALFTHTLACRERSKIKCEWKH